jgi:APA family basic amino acid/polyamine antiporter
VSDSPSTESGGASAARLSLFDATMLVMGGIIGVGIFFKPHSLAQIVPYTGPYFALWIIGAIAALAGAMTFAELGGSFPRTGGWYVFLREGFGPMVAFLFAWIVLLVISTGACAAVGEFAAQRLWALWAPDQTPSFAQTRGIAAIMVLGVTALGMCGIKTSVIFQNICMLTKLLAIGAFVFAGLVLYKLPPAIPTPAITDAASSGIPWAAMIRGLLPVLFTYGGWQLVTYIAPSLKDPERNLPRSIVLGVAGVGIVYLMLNWAYVRVLGIQGVAQMEDVPLELALRTFGESGATFLTAAMAISALGFLVATLIATPGIYVAMADEGLFVKAVGRRHSRTGAPVIALALQAMICLGYIALSSDVVNALADSVVFAEWIFHGLCALALLRLRRRKPELPRPFTSPLYPFFPVLYAGVAIAVVVGNLWASDMQTSGLGLAVLALGAVIYLPWSRAAGIKSS